MIGPPKPYTVTLTPVPGAVRTVPVTRVPRTAPDPAAEEKTRLVHEADEPPSLNRTTRRPRTSTILSSSGPSGECGIGIHTGPADGFG